MERRKGEFIVAACQMVTLASYVALIMYMAWLLAGR